MEESAKGGLVPKGRGQDVQPVTDKKEEYIAITNMKLDRLPSKGLTYPENAIISHRMYKCGELDMINNSNMTPKQLMELALKGINTSFDKMELTVPDFLFLGLLRKISIYNETSFTASCLCKKCKRKASSDIPAFDMEFDDLGIKGLPAKVTLNGKLMEFKPLTVGRFFDLLDKDMGANTLATYAAECTNMDFDEAYEHIMSLTEEDYEEIQFIDEAMHHGVKPIEIKCTSTIKVEGKGKAKDKEVECGQINLVHVQGGDVLITPFRKQERIKGSRVQFG